MKERTFAAAHMYKRPSLSKEQALQKVRHYCAYQERCHSEVREKLYSFGLRKTDVEDALSTLIEENYLNEERFAGLFAGGHFRTKQWGRIRIRYELKQKQVGDYCIRKALAVIDEVTYEETLAGLARKKWDSLTGESDRFVRQRKVQSYLLQKGYEPDYVTRALASLKT